MLETDACCPLFQLATPLEWTEFVQPVALPESMLETDAGTDAIVTGWGALTVSYTTFHSSLFRLYNVQYSRWKEFCTFLQFLKMSHISSAVILICMRVIPKNLQIWLSVCAKVLLFFQITGNLKMHMIISNANIYLIPQRAISKNVSPICFLQK